MANQKCGFFHVSSNGPMVSIIVILGATEWPITSVDFFHASSNGLIVRAFLVTLGTTEWPITSVDFFMSFQMA